MEGSDRLPRGTRPCREPSLGPMASRFGVGREAHSCPAGGAGRILTGSAEFPTAAVPSGPALDEFYPTTSATTAVTLSLPPAALASSMNRRHAPAGELSWAKIVAIRS